MSDEKQDKDKLLMLPNATRVVSKVAAIGEALEEMCLANRGAARRFALKDRIIPFET